MPPSSRCAPQMCWHGRPRSCLPTGHPVMALQQSSTASAGHASPQPPVRAPPAPAPLRQLFVWLRQLFVWLRQLVACLSIRLPDCHPAVRAPPAPAVLRQLVPCLPMQNVPVQFLSHGLVSTLKWICPVSPQVVRSHPGYPLLYRCAVWPALISSEGCHLNKDSGLHCMRPCTTVHVNLHVVCMQCLPGRPGTCIRGLQEAALSNCRHRWFVR